jgi:hypothetical protein
MQDFRTRKVTRNKVQRGKSSFRSKNLTPIRDKNESGKQA